jgi:DNA polymerase-3 subunit beta
MGCLYFDKKEEQLNIVASNGHVLIKNVEKADWYKEQNDVSFMMPKKVANTLLPIIDKFEIDDVVRFYVDERQVKAECKGTFMLQFRTPEGKYPNYDSVIPAEQPYFARGDRQAMIQAIKNVSPFANNSSNMVVMRLQTLVEDPDGDTLEFIGEDADFSTSATDRIHVHDNYMDDHINIGMKASSLIDSLGRLVDHDVEIQFADPYRAVTIRPLNPVFKDEEVTMLIMPMLINDSEK